MTNPANEFFKMKIISHPFIFALFVLIGISSFTLVSCGRPPKPVDTVSGQFIIRNFDPLANWHVDTAGNVNTRKGINKSILLDYSGAIENGFIIPTVNQVEDGVFEFTFAVKN